MTTLDNFIIPTQKMLFKRLKRFFKDCISCNGAYILVKGEAPILLIAHLDTVHKQTVEYICKSACGSIWMSPQGIGGDDRCGVYGIFSAYEKAEVKPWLLFTCDEEIGGLGANIFCNHHKDGRLPKELDNLKLLIELDRQGEKDAVFYDCGNKDFECYICEKGYSTAKGSFSDISLIAPELGVSAVNLSSGYYNAHSLHEHINTNSLEDTIQVILEIVAESVREDFPRYEYLEAPYSWVDELYYFDPITFYEDDATIRILLDELPSDIKKEYVALLNFYGVQELESLRVEFGDLIIQELFQSEIDSAYDGSNYYGDCINE